jgi:hypothetical protein
MSESSMKPTDIKHIKQSAEAKDPLLDAYHAAAKDDGFAPAPRVKGAVLMYARTLADHRNAFPGSVAHHNEDEELELSSVPVAANTLDPRPLPIKPLEDELPSWPRDLPPVAAPSAWASVGKWAATAAAGGLALGASFSWFSGNFHKPAAPEPIIVAQAPAVATVPILIPPPVLSEPSLPVKPSVAGAAPTVPTTATTATTAARQAAPTTQIAQAQTNPRTDAALARPKAAAVPQARARSENVAKELPIGAISNPPVMVADGRAIAPPQIAARPLADAKSSDATRTDATRSDAKASEVSPTLASPAAITAPATAAATRPAPAIAAADGSSAVASKALARPEHEADPQAWMSYILDLRSRGRSREASIELVRLRDRYPKFNAGTPAAGAVVAPASAPQ